MENSLCVELPKSCKPKGTWSLLFPPRTAADLSQKAPGICCFLPGLLLIPNPNPSSSSSSSLCHLNFWGNLALFQPHLEETAAFASSFRRFWWVHCRARQAPNPLALVCFAVVSCAASQWQLHGAGSVHVPRIQPGPRARGPGQSSAPQHQLCSPPGTSSCLSKVWIQPILHPGGGFCHSAPSRGVHVAFLRGKSWFY